MSVPISILSEAVTRVYFPSVFRVRPFTCHFNLRVGLIVVALFKSIAISSLFSSYSQTQRIRSELVYKKNWPCLKNGTRTPPLGR